MGHDFPSFALQKGRGCFDGFLFSCQPIVWPSPIWHLITPAQFKHLRSEHSLGQNSTQSSSTFRPKPKFKRALPSLIFLFDDSDDIQFSNKDRSSTLKSICLLLTCDQFRHFRHLSFLFFMINKMARSQHIDSNILESNFNTKWKEKMLYTQKRKLSAHIR